MRNLLLRVGRLRRRIAILSLVALALAPALHAQQKKFTRIGYIFPAGGQRGATCEAVVGGEMLDGVQGVYISGTGVRAKAFTYEKPLQSKRFNELREYIEDARKVEMQVRPLTHQQVKTLADEIVNLPADLIAKAKVAMGG